MKRNVVRWMEKDCGCAHQKCNNTPKSPFSEMNNPRIPKKPGQPDKSDKHSNLCTDEDPKGTIHGLGFKDVATAKQK